MKSFSNKKRLDQIKNGESRTVEFKSKLPSSENLAKTVVAFSNGAGGELLIGVDNSGKINGLDDESIFDIKDRVANIIYDMCFPAIVPEFFVESVYDKNILIVKIFSGALKPYYLKKHSKSGGIYIRVGATNRQADAEAAADLERQRRNIGFDEEIDGEYDLKDLDYSFLKKIFKKIRNKDIDLNSLINLKLVKKQNGHIAVSRAFLILAGAYENSRCNCARFKGSAAEVFIDKKEFAGDVFTQIQSVEIFLKNHLNLSGKIKGFVREDNFEVPLVALREAVINAFVHRDYSRRGSDIKIAVFDNAVEITSPGVLPNSISVENILSEGRSEIRNTVIARVFKELNYIEQWGTGMAKIRNSCESAGLKTPQIKENGGFTQVVLFRPADAGGYRRIPADSSKCRRIVVETNEKQNVLCGQEQKIIDFVEANQQINLKEAMELLGVKESRARELLGLLVKKDALVKNGSARSTFYTTSNKKKSA